MSTVMMKCFNALFSGLDMSGCGEFFFGDGSDRVQKNDGRRSWRQKRGRDDGVRRKDF